MSRPRKQQLDLSGMALGAKGPDLPSGPRARDPEEEARRGTIGPRGPAAVVEPERELNWGAARTGPSAAGGGGFGRGPAAATAPAARSDGDWGNLRGSGPSAPAPSRAHDADSWGNLRGGGGSSSASKSGKYIPPSQRGGGMSSSPSGFGGGSVRDAGRFAGLGGGGGGGLGSAFGSSRRDDRGSGRLGGMGGGMGGRRDNPAFASAFGSSRRSDSSMGGAGPGKYSLGGVTDPDGPRKMSSHALDKAQSGVRQEAATAAKAGTLTGAGEAEAHIAAQVAKDEEFVLRTLKAKWKQALEDWLLNMAPSANATTVTTLATYGLPLFHKDAMSVVLTRACRARRDADKERYVSLANALRCPREGGKGILVTPSSVWHAAAKTLTMLEAKPDTFPETSAVLAGILSGMLASDTPLPDDELVEAEEDSPLAPLKEWAESKGVLDAGGAAAAAEAADPAELAAQLLASGKKGTALADAAKEAFTPVSRDAAATAFFDAVLRAAATEQTLGNVRCPWAEEDVYGAALEAVVDGSVTAGVAALFAVQTFLDAAGWPKGVIEGIFLKFYQEDIVDDESFTLWKNDVTTKLPGRMQAIMQTNKWFAWFAEQSAESDDEEEEEEEEEDDEDLPQGGKVVNSAVLR